MRLLAALVSLLLPLNGVQPDLFESLYSRGQSVRATIKTIAAEFTDTTVSPLLLEPIIDQGTLVAAQPGDLIMEYKTGERRTVIVTGDSLIVFWPDERRREMKRVSSTLEAVDKYFTDATPQELRRLFDIAASTDAEFPDTYRVDMTPRRDEIRKGLASLRLWVDRETVLMKRMSMAFPDGTRKLIELDDMRLNVPVDGSTFAIPGDVLRHE